MKDAVGWWISQRDGNRTRRGAMKRDLLERIGQAFGVLIVIVLPLAVTVSGLIEIATRTEYDFFYDYGNLPDLPQMTESDIDRKVDEYIIRLSEFAQELDRRGCRDQEKLNWIAVDRSALEAECDAILDAMLRSR